MSTTAPNNEKFVFEKRPYNADSSPEVIQAMKDRVNLWQDDILLLEEIPVMTPFSASLILNEIVVKKEQARLDHFNLIVDLRACKRPSPESRRKINELFPEICRDVLHVSYVTGKSSLLNTVIRFVMFQTGLNSYSFDKGMEDALESIRKVNNG